jgi:hypothetical protein
MCLHLPDGGAGGLNESRHSSHLNASVGFRHVKRLGSLEPAAPSQKYEHPFPLPFPTPSPHRVHHTPRLSFRHPRIQRLRRCRSTAQRSDQRSSERHVTPGLELRSVPATRLVQGGRTTGRSDCAHGRIANRGSSATALFQASLAALAARSCAPQRGPLMCLRLGRSHPPDC